VLINRLDTARSESEHQQLCVMASEVFQLAGEIFFDSDLYADATHCYNLAASAAKEGRAHDQWACALTRHAYVSMYDQQYRQAATILDAAAPGSPLAETVNWPPATGLRRPGPSRRGPARPKRLHTRVGHRAKDHRDPGPDQPWRMAAIRRQPPR
jgi:hypothetical protein